MSNSKYEVRVLVSITVRRDNENTFKGYLSSVCGKNTWKVERNEYKYEIIAK